MNILDKITAQKKIEIQATKQRISIAEWERKPYFSRESYSLKQHLLMENSTGIIAEFKRKSPSKGILHTAPNLEEIIKNYQQKGASGVSILTDKTFFGGCENDLEMAREWLKIPILRKDFIIDEYQVIQSKAIGADVILLIAACLPASRVMELAKLAKNIGLEVLLEVHHQEELGHICDEIDLVGVNNRDLKTFEVQVQKSLDLSQYIPREKVRISESGISDISTVLLLKKHDFKGFLMGEHFMKSAEPTQCFSDFMHYFNIQM